MGTPPSPRDEDEPPRSADDGPSWAYAPELATKANGDMWPNPTPEDEEDEAEDEDEREDAAATA